MFYSFPFYFLPGVIALKGNPFNIGTQKVYRPSREAAPLYRNPLRLKKCEVLHRLLYNVQTN